MPTNNKSGLRRGAWTEEEDCLLRKCIHKYGQGNWHRAPARAGLNRCRKSCRLRWLNYLRPDINREQFTSDEVDLIIRLHKLLGNRWSLIAGRLPGRTANDVKNYWNTHLLKKVMVMGREAAVQVDNSIINNNSNIFKPRPQRTPTKNPSNSLKVKTTTCNSNISASTTGETPKTKDKSTTTTDLENEGSPPFPTTSLLQTVTDAHGNDDYWWDDLLFPHEEDRGGATSFFGGGSSSASSAPHVRSLLSSEESSKILEGGRDGKQGGQTDDSSSNLCGDYSDLWDLLLYDHPPCNL